MPKNIWITVICSCYNHSDYVTESIQSVLDQTYKNVQLIVVDDFSTDDSVQIIENFIKDFPEIIFIKNKLNLGLTKSVNNAMTLAQGSFFIDLAADDILLPNCIENQLKAFQTSPLPNLAIVYGNAELISENGKHQNYYFKVDSQFKTIEKRPTGNIYAALISPKTIICSVSSMVKKSVFDELKGYDENLSYEDYDFWIRVSRKHTIEFIDTVLIKKRMLPNSLYESFLKSKNKHGYSTHQILKKALQLNQNKKENKILLSKIYIEIKIAIKTKNYFLAFMNSKLFLKVGIKSI
jgi:glycosyltransferase involved in cell wall biosynthesis